MRLNDTKPDSRARRAVLLSMYEEAFKFRKLPKKKRGEEHSPKWKALIYGIKDKMEWGNVEIIIFIGLVREHTKKQIRQYLLDNNSKIVRHGKRTYSKRRKK